MSLSRLILLVSALGAGAAHAASGETYLTLTAASGSFEAAAPAGCTLNETSRDGVGAGLGFGYRFSDPWAVELGYQTLGSLDLDGVCGIAATPFTVTAPDSGLYAAGVGRLRFAGGWALLGRAGAYSWSGGGEGGTEALLGVGAEYQWREGFAARLEYAAYGSDMDAVALTFRLGF